MRRRRSRRGGLIDKTRKGYGKEEQEEEQEELDLFAIENAQGAVKPDEFGESR